MHCISFKFLVPIMTGGLEKKKKKQKKKKKGIAFVKNSYSAI
jgi:hypothetical protein